MPPTDHDRRGHVVHLVLAAVELESARRDALGKLGIAFQTVAGGEGVNPVKLRTDILPAGRDQHPAAQIENRHADRGQPVDIVQQRLQRRNIHHIGQFQRTNITLGTEQAVELGPHPVFTVAQCRLGLLTLGDILLQTLLRHDVIMLDALHVHDDLAQSQQQHGHQRGQNDQTLAARRGHEVAQAHLEKPGIGGAPQIQQAHDDQHHCLQAIG